MFDAISCLQTRIIDLIVEATDALAMALVIEFFKEWTNSSAHSLLSDYPPPWRPQVILFLYLGSDDSEAICGDLNEMYAREFAKGDMIWVCRCRYWVRAISLLLLHRASQAILQRS